MVAVGAVVAVGSKRQSYSMNVAACVQTNLTTKTARPVRLTRPPQSDVSAEHQEEDRRKHTEERSRCGFVVLVIVVARRFQEEQALGQPSHQEQE